MHAAYLGKQHIVLPEKMLKKDPYYLAKPEIVKLPPSLSAPFFTAGS